MQSNFLTQKEKIKKIITASSTYDRSYNIVFSYPKFYCKLNYIEHFWCHSKGYAKHYYEYSFEKLRIQVPEALTNVANSTILSNYNCCREKMALYKVGIEYRSLKWKSKTSHQKTYIKEKD